MVRAELAPADGFRPAEELRVGAFLYDADAVVAVAEISFRTFDAAGEDVAAYDAQTLGIAAVECCERGKGSTGKHLHIGGFNRCGSGHGHFAADIVNTFGEGLSDCREGEERKGPDDVPFEDGGDVGDLDTHVAGGMLAFEDMLLRTADLVEYGFFTVQADVHRGDLRQGVDCGLDVRGAVAERELRVGCERCGIERRYKNGLRLGGGIRYYAVRPLNYEGPKAACKNVLLYLVGVELARLLAAKVEGRLLFLVGIDENCEQFAFLSTDYLLHDAAHGGCYEYGGIGLVRKHRRTAEDAVAFLDEQTGTETLEAFWPHGDCVGSHGFGKTQPGIS